MAEYPELDSLMNSAYGDYERIRKNANVGKNRITNAAAELASLSTKYQGLVQGVNALGQGADLPEKVLIAKLAKLIGFVQLLQPELDGAVADLQERNI